MSKLKFAAIETLLGSKKKQTLSPVFPRVKLANINHDFETQISENSQKLSASIKSLQKFASGDFLKTFENVYDLHVVLVSC